MQFRAFLFATAYLQLCAAQKKEAIHLNKT